MRQSHRWRFVHALSSGNCGLAAAGTVVGSVCAGWADLFWVNDLACDRLLHFRYGRIREVSEGPDGYIAEDWND